MVSIQNESNNEICPTVRSTTSSDMQTRNAICISISMRILE